MQISHAENCGRIILYVVMYYQGGERKRREEKDPPPPLAEIPGSAPGYKFVSKRYKRQEIQECVNCYKLIQKYTSSHL